MLVPPCAAPANDDVACDALIVAVPGTLRGNAPPPVLDPPPLAAALCEMEIAPFEIEPAGVYAGRLAVTSALLSAPPTAPIVVEVPPK